jgi:leader peptidase (prepilin peptidase)/N-methyltransferase
MELLLISYVVLLGLCFGSFALAVADRERSKRDWVRGRSVCESCHHKLGFLDLVPVLSWLSTAGHCRYCRVKLSVRYPLVEAGVGVVFLLSYLAVNQWTFVAVLQLVLWLVAVVMMTVLFVIDARSYLLPYKFLFPLVGVAFVYAITLLFSSDQSVVNTLLMLVGSVAVGGGLFLILHVVSNGRWIGDGDIFLGVAIGLFLGNPFLTWFALIVASVFGLAYAGFLYVVKKTSLRRAKIPFGPFLISALVIAYLVGQPIIDWYARTVLFL